MTSVQAQRVDLKQFEESARLLNQRANWRLFSQDLNRGVELYYDVDNIMHLETGSVAVVVKRAYKMEKAISELKRQRNRTMGSAGEGLKYDELAFSIESFEILCSMKKIRIPTGITFDFDKQANILNYVPTHGFEFTISPGTPGEKLYALVCSQQK